MASIYAQAMMFMSLCLMFGVSFASKSLFNGSDWYSFNHPKYPPQKSSKIAVGGDSQKWNFGFDYTAWALQNGPFYLNDTLVFKFDPPSSTSFPHSVYLLPDWWSFMRCDIKKGKMVANPTQGGGDGFKFVLKKWQPYFFACGERGGFHCRNGTMKFFVIPSFRGWNN